MLIGSCSILPGRNTGWDEAIPPQHTFEQLYAGDTLNQALQSEREYLTWVVRFYKGWEIFPLGWDSIQNSVLATIDERHRAKSEKKLEHLGRLIADAWAKHNSIRHINTKMLSIWGGVIEAAAEQKKTPEAIDQITQDVLDLISETLTPTEIRNERYRELLRLKIESDKPLL